MTTPDPADRNPDPVSRGAAEPEIDPNSLSSEEQLAAYEEALKEEDWGHQPC